MRRVIEKNGESGHAAPIQNELGKGQEEEVVEDLKFCFIPQSDLQKDFNDLVNMFTNINESNYTQNKW
jgi:hypothetical protein